MTPLEKSAQQAIEKHRRLFQNKVLEMTLGEMIALDGIADTRKKLMWWYKHLAEFENE